MQEENKSNRIDLSKYTNVTILPLTIWMSANFAEDWFKDAILEAQTGEDHNARRRQIIFATCFAESYLFEWTRRLDAVGIDRILEYFPPKRRFRKDPRYKRDLKSNWKCLPQELHKEGKIEVSPKLDLSDLGQLIRYRNGLVHAIASRPSTDSQPEEEKPVPSRDELDMLPPGWALNIVSELVTDFHGQLGTPVPGYFRRQ